MKHIAILRQPFFDLVLSGQKTIESRFSMKKVAPFDKIKVGDDILLKQTGKPVTAKAVAKDVKFFELTPDLIPEKFIEALNKSINFQTLLSIRYNDKVKYNCS